MSFKLAGDYLFTGERLYNPLSHSQYTRLVKKWATYARLDPRDYSTHRLRRTKSSVVYEKTRNLAACRELLGHKSIGSTAAYLGVDQRQALDLAKKIEV
jgi:site-specific recombinase XerD